MGKRNPFRFSAYFDNFGLSKLVRTVVQLPKRSVPGPVYRYSKRSGEYRLTQGSPCAGAGTWQTWMEGALDIYGRAWNPDRVDIGAAVYDCKGLMLLVK